MRNLRVHGRRLLGLCAVALAVVCAVVVAENVAISYGFPRLSRPATDFSPAYLTRELRATAAAAPAVIFLGDSVLWGYNLAPDRTAVTLLDQRGCTCQNLSFKNGSPPNFYALARLFEKFGVRPKSVVIEINQKVFNAADPSYNTLHPSVALLAHSMLSSSDLAVLTPPAEHSSVERALDRAGSKISILYAMRTDVRALVFGESPDAVAGPLVADDFEGDYDLTPLNIKNVGVRFLSEAVKQFRSNGVPVLAFLTPTNHRLLHDYIDNAGYDRNRQYLRRLLEQDGARVLDLDASFPASDFLDNAHLNAAGQQRLANALAPLLPR